ncbi:hypothetical protein [Saccharothrix sp. ST-888]|uniref:hypothetical protein n=1 Tax=Saccharothrix sp. ST-888 TaxID=1427391 RepID=UPI0018CD4174|nr:hypothetical protein [Saccharothrix sp. ST-888]
MAAGTAALTGCSSGGTAAEPRSAGSATTAAPLSYVPGTAKDNNAPAGTGDFFNGPGTDPAAMKWVQLSAGAAGALNPVLRNGAGFTLYRFDKDSANPSKSTCDGACATTWPPVLVQPGSKIFLDGVAKSDVGAVKRDDGTLQVTVGGWPVYRFSKDTAPGQTNGQGVGGTWFGVTPDGGKAGQSPQGTDSDTGLDYRTGTAKQNNAPQGTGDLYTGARNAPDAMKWVQLTAGSANGLNPIVHDGAGFTIYRFDKDSAKPSKSTCDGACATTWPPVLVQPGSKIFVDGVPTSKIGIVTRTDGTRQVTIGGWPVYRFSKDTAPGQTNGEGVGGTWFAVSPSGGKVLPAAGDTGASTASPGASGGPAAPTAAPSGGSTGAPSPAGSSVALGNGNVTLDSGVNFTEPNGSEALAGPGCKNVSQANSASSLDLSGGPVKIWTGPDCTGTSAVVTGSIADLSTIGFDKKIVSIRFGN